MCGSMAGMRFRKLRIVWSGVCAAAYLGFLSLWVQTSHISRDFTVGRLPYGIWVSTMSGQVTFSSLPDVEAEHKRLGLPPPERFSVPRYAGGTRSEYQRHDFTSTVWGDYTVYFSVPLWLLAVLAAMIGVIPWIRWSNRFTIRTLFIAMTLVAVVLGLILCVARK
jgi:hypothetical protein